MLSLSSVHRAKRGSERKSSDDEALAIGASDISMNTMRGDESYSSVHPFTTTETRIIGGLPHKAAVHYLPADGISVQNGIAFEEERFDIRRE